MIVVFDCDDVLANMREPLSHVVSTVTNRFAHWSEWEEWGACVDDYDITFYDIIPHILKHNILEQLVPDPDAVEVTSKLQELGFEIVIVTARGFHPNAQAMTTDWLHRHDIKHDRVLITDPHTPKSNVIELLGPVEIYIDDNSDHIRDVIQLCNNVNTTVIRSMPWNTNFNHPKRVDNLLELLTFV